ncbi:MAG: archaeosortase/exosortase family protein [Candidatus Magnetoovum sp. WYHC-5]|nr:archaeosortase/exosortase family protein [Candidatus Magnetoovum sp. WYHC-5]
MISKKKNYTNKHSNKRNPTILLLNYIFLTIITILLINYRPVKELLDINGVYSNSLAAITCKALSLIDIGGSCSGPFISLQGLILEVKFGCNGLEAALMFAIAVIVFPAPWKIKLAGITVGFIVLQLINIIRILLLAYVGVRYPQVFDFFHFYIAQGLMIAIALGILIVYLRHATSKNYA